METADRKGYWNYRVLDQEDDKGLVLVEVYYEDSYTNDQAIWAWSFASPPYGDDLGELEGDLEGMAAALSMPVLTMADLPGDDTPEVPV